MILIYRLKITLNVYSTFFDISVQCICVLFTCFSYYGCCNFLDYRKYFILQLTNYYFCYQCLVESSLLSEFFILVSFQILDCCHFELSTCLKLLFPWYEYLVRAGWTPDGQHVWVQLLDRYCPSIGFHIDIFLS